MLLRQSRSFISVLGFAVGATTIAHADMTSFNFISISANNVINAGVGESQLSLQVSDVLGQPGQALFTFLNSGPLAASITDVYFDGDVLQSIASIIGSPGVSFSQGAAPPVLPAGATIGFSAVAALSADSDPPVVPNGVNPGESLNILFNLVNGKTYADVINALNLGVAQGPTAVGSLVVGIHVQGFAGGGSESFVTGSPVPAPGAAILGLMGLGMISHLRRRLM